MVELGTGKSVYLVSMAENLKTTKYNDGTSIPQVSDATAWSNLFTGATCDYDNLPGNGSSYGKLYNWYAVYDSRNVCPTGWHVPNWGDWTSLADILGGDAVAGCKLKEIGIAHWNTPNAGATNETGFTALPGGGREASGSFTFMGRSGHWWSSTSYSYDRAYARGLASDDCAFFILNPYNKREGYSVRCIKD